MAQSNKPPKSIGELVDHLEQIREDLLSIQRTMEKMETKSALTAKEQSANEMVKEVNLDKQEFDSK
jgi:hypothetical protein